MSLCATIQAALPPPIAEHESTTVFYERLLSLQDSDVSHLASCARDALNLLQDYARGPVKNIEGVLYNSSQERFAISVYAAHKRELQPRATLQKHGLFLRSLAGLSSDCASSSMGIPPSRPPEIIGYEEVKERVFSLVHRLGYYQNDLKKNAELRTQKIPVMILAGEPGCGKSLFLDHAKYLCSQIAAYKGISCQNVSITNADKSTYQSGSAKNLRELVSRALHPQGISVIAIDEADVVFPADARTEADQQFTSEFIKMISAEGMQYAGNAAVFMATNYPHRIDHRLLDRCGRANLLTLTQPTDAAFITDVMRSKIDAYEHALTKADIATLSCVLQETDLSIREFTNLIEAANERNKRYAHTEVSAYALNPTSSCAGPLTLEHLKSVLEDYYV